MAEVYHPRFKSVKRRGTMSLTLRTGDRKIATIILSIQLGLVAWSGSSLGAVPDLTQSYYVPQAGPMTSPVVGIDALRSFRLCPNNDGTQSLPNSARIKIVIRNAAGGPISGIPREDFAAAF